MMIRNLKMIRASDVIFPSSCHVLLLYPMTNGIVPICRGNGINTNIYLTFDTPMCTMQQRRAPFLCLKSELLGNLEIPRKRWTRNGDASKINTASITPKCSSRRYSETCPRGVNESRVTLASFLAFVSRRTFTLSIRMTRILVNVDSKVDMFIKATMS